MPTAILIPAFGVALYFLFRRKKLKVPRLLLEVVRKPNPTPRELTEAAREAKAEGLTVAATTLAEKALILHDESRLPATVSSPFPSVTDKQWSLYTKRMQRFPLDKVGPQYHLGMFYIGQRSLADIGMVDNVKKVKLPSGRTAYKGEWVEPLSLEVFLSSPGTQYDAFGALSVRDRRSILGRYKGYIGKTIEGRKVTLSGLMGAAQQAGIAGLGKWLTDPKTRKKFTTDMFKKSNGIF